MLKLSPKVFIRILFTSNKIIYHRNDTDRQWFSGIVCQISNGIEIISILNWLWSLNVNISICCCVNCSVSDRKTNNWLKLLVIFGPSIHVQNGNWILGWGYSIYMYIPCYGQVMVWSGDLLWCTRPPVVHFCSWMVLDFSPATNYHHHSINGVQKAWKRSSFHKMIPNNNNNNSIC